MKILIFITLSVISGHRYLSAERPISRITRDATVTDGLSTETANSLHEDQVTTVLRLIELQRKSCTPGTELSLVGVVDQYGTNRFRAEAMAAVNRANFLTQLWRYPPAIYAASYPLLRNQSEQLLFAAVREMVEGNANIVSASNCYDSGRYPSLRPLFCPYAYRTAVPGEILVKDLANTYEYDDYMEWFGAAKRKAEEVIAHGRPTRANSLNVVDGANSPKNLPLVTYEDGHWSTPYYDCGGLNMWLMTYSVPFFGHNATSESLYFMGTSGVDVDLRKVDIDQCPSKSKNSTAGNVFAGSAKCRPTTECRPISGQGFRRGAYACHCLEGYYFPNGSGKKNESYFNGVEIEEEFEKQQQGETSGYDRGFTCLPCPAICTTGCLDGSTYKSHLRQSNRLDGNS